MTMRILYGVQGTGNGHISRARKMAAHLRQRGAETTFLFSGRATAGLFEMEAFGAFLHRQGLTFITRDGGIDPLSTLIEARPLRFLRDIRELDPRGYDLVVTDFEPVSAWAARRRGVPVVGIGHQYAFRHAVPMAGDRWHSRTIMRHFAPADIAVGLHWHPFGAPVLPPIIDTGLTRDASDGRTLVYLPFENQSTVTRLLSHFPAHHFVQYAPGLEDSRHANVDLRRTCLEGFRRDLCRARAVICNAGFELVSECLHLGLPVLVKPLRGQMEQASNAAALRRLGWGSSCEQLDEVALGEWLVSPAAPPALRYPDVASHLADWLLAGACDDLSELFEILWQGIPEPTVRCPTPLPAHA